MKQAAALIETVQPEVQKLCQKGQTMQKGKKKHHDVNTLHS